MSYPVKYAPMPVLVTREWDSCLGRTNGSLDVYYIISRCMVLKETKRYFASQVSDNSYKVRFPYNVIGSNDFLISENSHEAYVERVYDESELDELNLNLLRVNKKLLSKRMYFTNYESEKIRELTSSYQKLVDDFSLIEGDLENILKKELPFENEMSLSRK
jgi:hypothetical protein